ncbi:MAG: hypothetical protein JWP78_2590 [Mucilaginibacter sp.]|nr:hypothetical protein [Mucilaginibacter sp.]
MKTGRYSFRELLLHQEIEQIIIPEVQRDYVWQTPNVERLLDNILQFFDERSNLRLEISINGIANSEEHLVSHLQKELERLQYHLKIGFIYAYHDPSYPGKFFLIDGQQRFTTLYLLLLSLYKMTSRQDDFRYNYFSGDQLKIDYKVRRAVHDFMRDFVRHELSDETHDFSKSKFYYRHYENDVTINNLLINYQFITKYIKSKTGPNRNLTDLRGFLEDFVELNFFDTQLSAQGEQLYLYMNARGEQLSFQEEIKSTVISRVAVDDKRQAGKAWEDWQNFFWRHRKYENEQEQKVSRENADAGFQEFLKWATIIQVATSDNEQLMVYLSGQSGNARRPYRELKTSLVSRSRRGEADQLRVLENYQLARAEFSSEYLGTLADAIIEIYDDHIAIAGGFMKGAYLANDFQASSYLIICPLIYYYSHIRLKESDDHLAAMKSMGMWLKNLTYFSSTVGRRPDDSTIYLLEIMKLMIEADENDIAGLLTLVKPGQYSEILPVSERNRLELLKRHGTSTDRIKERDELEHIMWDVTNDKKTNAFLEGNMSILFDCVAYDFSVSFNDLLLGNEELEALKDYWIILKDLIVPEVTGNLSDTLRRAMLTFGDYSIQESGSWAFGNYIEKYSFLSNQAEWRSFFKSDKPKQFFLEMIISQSGKSSVQLPQTTQ